MLSEELKLRYSRGLTHYVYRNTELEDYHSNGTTMNDEFYNIMYKIVSEKLKLPLKLQKFVFIVESTGEFESVLSKMNLPKKIQFINYAKEIDFNSKWFGTDWDNPTKLDILPKEDLAEYILGGKFKEFCNINKFLDQNAMKELNKDVHNRIYTLICNGYFE